VTILEAHPHATIHAEFEKLFSFGALTLSKRNLRIEHKNMKDI
jgi:hypothetical protein